MAFMAKIANGKVELYNSSTGGKIRSFGSDVQSAVVSGDEVHATLKNGRVEIYSANTGSKLRTI